DLSAYAGQNIYIAFRHHNSSDLYWLLLDDICVSETTQTETNYTVTVLSNNPELGSVSGGGTYPAGTVTTIAATAASGCRFVQWNDGNTDAIRTITVTGNITYTAYFEAVTPYYTITVLSADETMGTALGSGTYLQGDMATISAQPLAGYHFVRWNDGVMDNPRSFIVMNDATYIANFAPNQGIGEVADDIRITPLPNYSITVTGVGGRTVEVFDMMGRRHANQRCDNDPITLQLPAAGVYMVVVDGQTAYRVVLVD
ncbi:MAG: hypothetical protein J5641_05535, partial [Bacteroidales bacterium]|nr:hypothetical protein [Bacteroidales bacterium]